MDEKIKKLVSRFGLSTREAEVAAWVCEGLNNRPIAEKLYIAEKTVKFHLTNIYSKAKVKGRAQLIVKALAPTTSVKKQEPLVDVPLDERLPSGV